MVTVMTVLGGLSVYNSAHFTGNMTLLYYENVFVVQWSAEIIKSPYDQVHILIL